MTQLKTNTMPKSLRQSKKHYINNADFYQALKAHSEKRALHIVEGKKPPIPSDYIGKCIMDIAAKMSTKYNFFGYTFRDEMVADAVEMCTKYLNNFNVNKSNNPFSYFTQVSYCAFIRRIGLEKREHYVRAKSMQQFPFESEQAMGGNNDDGEGSHMFDNYHSDLSGFDAIIENFEKKLAEKLPKKKKKNAPEEADLMAILFEIQDEA